jgi:hypothetical protein
VIYRTVPLYDRHTPDAERLHRDSLLIIESQEDKSLILDVVSDKILQITNKFLPHNFPTSVSSITFRLGYFFDGNKLLL